jgi:pyruvate/2-oxoglutarate dehydrogenase complex dihydrolipoamide acyltransferase (E2) component
MTFTAIVLPDLHIRDEPVCISSWLVHPGEFLERGRPRGRPVDSRVTWSVQSPASGRLDEIRKPVNAEVTAGEIAGWIRREGTTTDRPGGDFAGGA